LETQPDFTELATFLDNLANRLIKEGTALQALADTWFEDKATDENSVLTQYGVDISALGRQLLVARSHICQACATQEIAESLSFNQPD